MAEHVTSRVERELFFRSFTRGAAIGDAAMAQFVEALEEQLVPAESVIYREGTPADHVTYVVRGKVRVFSADEAPREFGERSAIGGLDAMQGSLHSKSAVAAEDTLLLRIPIGDYFDVMEDNFEFGKSMLKFMFRGVEEGLRDVPAEIAYPDRAGNASLAALVGLDRLGLVEKLLVLRVVPVFRWVRMQVLVRLAEDAEERAVPAGTKILDGRVSDRLYTIASGRVRVQPKGGGASFGFSGGSMVLPFAAIGDLEHGYEAEVVAPSRILVIDKEHLFDVMEDHADLTRTLLAFGAGERQRILRAALPIDAPRAINLRP